MNLHYRLQKNIFITKPSNILTFCNKGIFGIIKFMTMPGEAMKVQEETSNN